MKLHGGHLRQWQSYRLQGSEEGICGTCDLASGNLGTSLDMSCSDHWWRHSLGSVVGMGGTHCLCDAIPVAIIGITVWAFHWAREAVTILMMSSLLAFLGRGCSVNERGSVLLGISCKCLVRHSHLGTHKGMSSIIHSQDVCQGGIT